MKKFKDFLLTKGISAEAFKALEATEQAKLHGEYMDTMAENSVSKEDYNALKAEFDTFKANGVDKSVTDDLQTKLDNLALEVEKERTVGKNVNSLEKEISENKEKIKSIAKGASGEVELKALINRASIGGNTNAYVLPDIGQLGVKRRALYDVLPKIQLSTSANDNGTVKYHDWNESTTVRAAEMVAEGGTFDESTAKFTEYTLKLKKIGDTLPVTEEFGEDAALAAAELERFLDVNVQTKIDDQIINGSGVDENLKGLIASVPAYTATAEAIPFANLKDLVRRMRTGIVKPRGSKYSPDIVVMNSDMYDTYYLAKDQEGNYLFDENDRIAGLAVVEDNNMPDNQIVVGDRRFATIYEKGGVVLSEGYVNEQYIEDTKTLKARKRLAMLIRTVDQTGFLKCTNVASALETLAEGSEPSI